MDAAKAAAMSDPDRNYNLRRRWGDESAPVQIPMPRPRSDALGPIGLALLDAWRKRKAHKVPDQEDGP